jgi:hypothetical protein
MNDEQQTITDPSANFALVIGTVTQNFPPRSGNGPALLKIKTERFGFGSHASSVFADYVPVTCWGQQRATCVRINIGDTVRAECRIGESKGKDDIWRVSITANSLTIFGEAPRAERKPPSPRGSGGPGPIVVADEADIPFAPCL